MISANRVLGSRSAADNNVVQGNIIGTDLVGTAILATAAQASPLLVAGNEIADNTIAFNSFAVSGTGVAAQRGSQQRHPQEFDVPERGLGIDLGDDGVTTNDADDTDMGANRQFNFPVLETATIADGNLTIAGFARPDSEIELFIADPDPSGFGEGQTFLVMRPKDRPTTVTARPVRTVPDKSMGWIKAPIRPTGSAL